MSKFGIQWRYIQSRRPVQSQSPRARVAAKRGGDAQPLDHSETVNLDEIAETRHRRVPRSWRWIRALDGLARVDARKARVIELRFFGGLSVEETAEVLQISAQSVMRDWKLARAWLVRELG